MFDEKDLIESDLAGAPPAPLLEGVDSDEDDLEASDDASEDGDNQEGEEASEDEELLDDEFDLEDADEDGAEGEENEEDGTSGDEGAMDDNILQAEDELEGDFDEEDDLLESEDDMALNLDTEGHRGLPDIQVVQMRIASATRVLGDWKTLGKKTGRSRSEVYEQFIDDICTYYGYNKFLAEKLVDLFSVDEVSAHKQIYILKAWANIHPNRAVYHLLRCFRHPSTGYHPCEYPQNPAARIGTNAHQPRCFA
jgi:hypothetical protein